MRWVEESCGFVELWGRVAFCTWMRGWLEWRSIERRAVEACLLTGGSGVTVVSGGVELEEFVASFVASSATT